MVNGAGVRLSCSGLFGFFGFLSVIALAFFLENSLRAQLGDTFYHYSCHSWFLLDSFFGEQDWRYAKLVMSGFIVTFRYSCSNNDNLLSLTLIWQRTTEMSLNRSIIRILDRLRTLSTQN
jgi:hypothetical protein